MQNAEFIRRLKLAAREKYAFPGGYPLYVVMDDCEPLCIKCLKSNFTIICRATRKMDKSEWHAAYIDINYESDMDCVHCQELIERAYV